MTPKINFNNLVCGLLPWIKRRPVRLSVLRTMVAPLGELFNDFSEWRRETLMIVNVNSQVAVLEGYLRSKYHQPIAIKIVTFDDGALEVCLEAEGETLRVDVPLDDQELDVPPPIVPLDGEFRALFGDVDFIVYIPQGIDSTLVEADIERFKQAFTRFKIIQN